MGTGQGKGCRNIDHPVKGGSSSDPVHDLSGERSETQRLMNNYYKDLLLGFRTRISSGKEFYRAKGKRGTGTVVAIVH